MGSLTSLLTCIPN